MYREEVLKETNEEEISVEEVCTSIVRLKSKKALCVCGITAVEKYDVVKDAFYVEL